MHLVESAGVYGAERVILALSREMLSSEEFEPVIGCLVQHRHAQPDLVAVAAAVGVESHCVLIRNWALPLDVVSAASQFKDLRIDLVHCHGYKPTIVAALARLYSRVPVMSTCHLWFVEPKTPLRTRIAIGIERLLYRFGHMRVVTVSDAIRNSIISYGAPEALVSVVANGISLEGFVDAIRPDPPKTAGFRIVNVARLAPQKAQRDLVQAAAIAAVSVENLQVVILGDGELRPALEAQIRELNAEGCVSLLGFRSDVQEMVAGADAFVLPSLDEGMPISLLEAVALKVPVIVTPVGDIPKLIEHERSGLVVNANDPEGLATAIIRLAKDKQLRASLAENAWLQLQRLHSSAEMFDGYAAVYRRESQVASGRRHTADGH
jgi:glycosyltransferase involved in cell wall biosynthesis